MSVFKDIPCLLHVVFRFIKLFCPILGFCITYYSIWSVSVLFILIFNIMTIWRLFERMLFLLR